MYTIYVACLYIFVCVWDSNFECWSFQWWIVIQIIHYYHFDKGNKPLNWHKMKHFSSWTQLNSNIFIKFTVDSIPIHWFIQANQFCRSDSYDNSLFVHSSFNWSSFFLWLSILKNCIFIFIWIFNIHFNSFTSTLSCIMNTCPFQVITLNFEWQKGLKYIHY